MIKMKFYARKGSSFTDEEAAVCGPELVRIEKLNEGLTPRMVVAEAADPESPLHPQFEWNNTVAATKYRDEQARRLIRNVVVRVMDENKDEEQEVRVFLNVKEKHQRSYRNISYVSKDENLQNQVVEQAHNELERWRIKWSQYKQLESFVDDVRLAQADHKPEKFLLRRVELENTKYGAIRS